MNEMIRYLAITGQLYISSFSARYLFPADKKIATAKRKAFIKKTASNIIVSFYNVIRASRVLVIFIALL